jgi:hypothetical protein
MRYEFKSTAQFVQDQRENKIPRFIFYALNYGTLQLRGPETDKKLYKTYFRKLPGNKYTTRVLREIKTGMVLMDNGYGVPVIEGDIGDARYQSQAINDKEVNKKAEKKASSKKRPGRPRKNPEASKVTKEKEEPKKANMSNRYYTQDEVAIPLLFKSTKGGRPKKMVPYKFISTEKFLKDIRSNDPAFEKLRIEYRKLNLRVIGQTLYTVYCGVFTSVDSTNYLVQNNDGRLVILKESDIES